MREVDSDNFYRVWNADLHRVDSDHLNIVADKMAAAQGGEHVGDPTDSSCDDAFANRYPNALPNAARRRHAIRRNRQEGGDSNELVHVGRTTAHSLVPPVAMDRCTNRLNTSYRRHKPSIGRHKRSNLNPETDRNKRDNREQGRAPDTPAR